MGVAEVRAFRGVRFAGALRSAIGSLLAPPYDVSYPHLIGQLRARHPENMVHLEHVEPDPGEDPHIHAATLYRDWLRRGILARDPNPAYYLYQHGFATGGERRVRGGVLAALRLADWSAGVILPHEATFPGPCAERLRRLRAVRANLSPIYLLSRDQDGALRDLLATLSNGPDLDGCGPDGEEHRLTRIADPARNRAIERFFSDRRLYVADGHHRYQAALAYRNERRDGAASSAVPGPDGPGAAEYILALVCPAEDPGVLVLPTHRLIRALPEFDLAMVRSTLAERFDVTPIAGEPGSVERLVEQPGVVCLARFTGEDGVWSIRIRPDTAHEALMPAARSAAWRRLGVAILSAAVLEGVLGITPDRFPAHVLYAHDAREALASVGQGAAQAAFLVRGSTVDELMAVADAGETMPPKSTYFWPKVPAGLVIHDLA
ncbi:MAG: DUF1015 domain-containing protein [Thermomicrobiales bacterium]